MRINAAGLITSSKEAGPGSIYSVPIQAEASEFGMAGREINPFFYVYRIGSLEKLPPDLPHLAPIMTETG